MIKYVILIAYLLFVAIATLCRPDFLAKNSFLDNFVGTELLGLLAVILSITFASVANIHLAINQIVSSVYRKDIERGQKIALPTRKDINENSWSLFWAFVACTGFLIVKGMFADNIFILSAMNGLALGTLLLNVLVFHDIYGTVFALAESDLAVKGANPPEYSPDTPPTHNEKK